MNTEETNNNTVPEITMTQWLTMMSQMMGMELTPEMLAAYQTMETIESDMDSSDIQGIFQDGLMNYAQIKLPEMFDLPKDFKLTVPKSRQEIDTLADIMVQYDSTKRLGEMIHELLNIDSVLNSDEMRNMYTRFEEQPKQTCFLIGIWLAIWAVMRRKNKKTNTQ